MASQVNNINQFWGELKRRKVFRVLAMYAATAFIIMEASDIMLPRLGLPDWTVTFVIILIIIGFPITAIVSWIFDITPEGLMKTVPLNKEKKKEIQVQSQPKRRFFNASNIVIAILIVVVVILAYPKVFGSNKSQFEKAREKKEVIAVLPFMNNTGDDSYDHWEYGISELLISSLSTSDELAVIDNQTITDIIRNVEIVQTASFGPEIAKEVASRIQVESYIYGTYLLAGPTFRINLKLIETKTNEVLKTVSVEGMTDSIFSMVDVLSEAINDYLEISILEEGMNLETGDYLTTTSPEAYKYFIQGMEALWAGRGDQGGAGGKFYRAIQIDSTFTSAYFFASQFFASIAQFNIARDAMLKAYEGKDQLPDKMQIWLEAFMAKYIAKNPYRAIKSFERVSEIDPLSRLNWFWLGSTYNQIEDYNNALLSFEQILKLNKQFGPWRNHHFYNSLGITYLQLEEYGKAQKIFEEGVIISPESDIVLRSQAVCAILQNDTSSANHFINHFESIYEFNNYFPESWVVSQIGKIYFDAGQIEKAEIKFRRALEMRLAQGPENEPINPGNDLFWYYDNLGRTLLENNKHVEEGMGYMKKAGALSQKAYSSIHPLVLYNMGSGYYKQGIYLEAHQVLRQAEENMLMYDHPLHQLIQEVEQALANQN